MSFFERDNELRRMHLLRDIAIAEAEEQAIKETLKDKQNEETKEQIKIVDRNAMPLVPEDKPVKPQETKQDRDPNAKPWVPKDPPIEPQETKQELNLKCARKCASAADLISISLRPTIRKLFSISQKLTEQRT